MHMRANTRDTGWNTAINLPDIPVTVPIILGVLIVGSLLVGGWLDMAYLGVIVKLWGFGPPRQRPRKEEKAVLHHRFGKSGPLIGWLFTPYEVIATDRRFIVNWRNAFNRLDIPVNAIKTLTVRRRPWPMVDDVIIGYSDRGTPKTFHLADNAKVVIDGLNRAGAQFRLG